MNNIKQQFATPPVVKNLLIINILLFLLSSVSESIINIDLYKHLAIFNYASDLFEPYQFISHLFLHADITHLFFNMFALWMFGRILESVWGSPRFFIYFMITGLGAAMIHLAVTYWGISDMRAAVSDFLQVPTPQGFETFLYEYFPDLRNPSIVDFIFEWKENPDNIQYINEAINSVKILEQRMINVPTVGASGAVFGVLLAFGMLFPDTELMLLFPPIPIKAKYFVIGYGAIELFLGVVNRSGDNVAHFAHLGGMIFGFVLIKMWAVKR